MAHDAVHRITIEKATAKCSAAWGVGFGLDCPSIFKGGRADSENPKLVKDPTVSKLTTPDTPGLSIAHYRICSMPQRRRRHWQRRRRQHAHTHAGAGSRCAVERRAEPHPRHHAGRLARRHRQDAIDDCPEKGDISTSERKYL